LSENQNSFLRPLKNKGFKEERVTKIGLYAIGKSTTLESNKSQDEKCQQRDTSQFAVIVKGHNPLLSYDKVEGFFIRSELRNAPPHGEGLETYQALGASRASRGWSGYGV
jgi:hypothetical protein